MLLSHSHSLVSGYTIWAEQNIKSIAFTHE